MRAAIVIVLALCLAACPGGGAGIVTSDGAGNIQGVEGIALGSPLSEPPPGFHRDPTSLRGTAFVKTEDAKVAGVPVKKEVQVFLNNGAVTSVSLVLVANSEAEGEKLGKAVLAGLQAEYGAQLQTREHVGTVASQGRTLNFGKGTTEVSITVYIDSGS